MARLVRRVATGWVYPGSAGPEDPQNAVENCPVIPPGPAAVLLSDRLRNVGIHDLPLFVGEFHRCLFLMFFLANLCYNHFANLALNISVYSDGRNKSFEGMVKTYNDGEASLRLIKDGLLPRES